jgi:hypothetical protein
LQQLSESSGGDEKSARRISLDDLSSAFQALATTNSLGNNNNNNNNNSSGGNKKPMTMLTGGDRHSSLSRNMSAGITGAAAKRGLHFIAGSGLVATRGSVSGGLAAGDCCQVPILFTSISAD